MGYRGELCQWEDRCDPMIPFPRHEVLPPCVHCLSDRRGRPTITAAPAGLLGQLAILWRLPAPTNSRRAQPNAATTGATLSLPR